MVIDHAAISAASRASFRIDELSSFVVSVCIVKRWRFRLLTTLGAAAGCISATAIGYGMKQYIDPGYVYNGVLAGLVSITSPCAVCSPVGAIIIGLIGGGV